MNNPEITYKNYIQFIKDRDDAVPIFNGHFKLLAEDILSLYNSSVLYSDGIVKIGSLANSNYTQFNSSGEIRLYGEATQWEDLNFDVVNAGGPAATRPSDVTIDNVYYKEFTSLNNQTCGDGEEIPHDYKLGSTMYPHLHLFLKNGETAGTTGVTFRLYYSYRQTGVTTVSGNVDLSVTSAQLTAEPYKINLYDTVGFVGPSKLGTQLSLRLDRIAGNAGDVIVITFGVHYEKDGLGSNTISTKY